MNGVFPRLFDLYKKFLSMKRFLLALFLCPLALYAQVNFQSSNLPIVLIETNGQAIPNDPKITATMHIIDHGPGQVNHINDAPNHYNGYIGIEQRGSSSNDLSDKKPYGVETRDAAGEDLDFPLLGMPEESDWVFMAPFNDKSLIRDALTLELARRIMPWASQTRFVELILNGEYQGIYIVVEKIKRDKNRVDISKLTENDIAGDELTGGYIVKLDKSTGTPSAGWSSPYNYPYNAYYQIDYPKIDDIKPEQADYIRNWMTDFEAVMAGNDYADPDHGFAQYLDVESFVDFAIINEITKNVDGYRLSTYLYKDKDSKDPRLHAGPVWDFNIALGNANYCGGDLYYGWAIDFNDQCPADGWQIPFWWNRMWDAPSFREKVKNRWFELRASTFSDAAIHGLVDSLLNVVDEAQVRNFQQWPVLDHWLWPNAYCCGTYQQQTNYLDTWLDNRIAWLDGSMTTLYLGEYIPADFFAPIVFPNPNHGNMTFKYYAHHGDYIQIEIFDAMGRQTDYVLESAVLNGTHTYAYQASLSQGVYFYTFRINGKYEGRGKFVVQP